VEGITITESFSSMKQGDSLGGLLFVLTHYRTLLETILRAPNYVFPSLTNDTHIVGPSNEITRDFDHLCIQLALVGLKVKVSKCKLWSPSRILLSIKIPQGYTLVTDDLCILNVLLGSQDFATHFLDEVLSQNMVRVDDLPLLGDTQVTLCILFSCVIR